MTGYLAPSSVLLCCSSHNTRALSWHAVLLFQRVSPRAVPFWPPGSLGNRTCGTCGTRGTCETWRWSSIHVQTFSNYSILSVSFQYPLAPGWILDDIFRSSHGRWKQACNSERDEKCLMVFPHASFHGKIVQPRAVSRPRKDKKIKQSEFQYFRQRFPERIPVGTLEQSFFHSEDGTAFDFG